MTWTLSSQSYTVDKAGVTQSSADRGRDAMEENLDRVHHFCLKERREGTLTGVVVVISFDSEQIFLETTQGMLTIRGRELHVSRLQLDLGEIDVEGTVDSFMYTEGGSYGRRQKGSLLGRLFS